MKCAPFGKVYKLTITRNGQDSFSDLPFRGIFSPNIAA
jgi:hypothetical protein